MTLAKQWVCIVLVVKVKLVYTVCACPLNTVLFNMSGFSAFDCGKLFQGDDHYSGDTTSLLK